VNQIHAQGVAAPKGNANHPRPENGVSKKVLHEMRDVSSLSVNASSETFYGTRDEDFEELVQSIRAFGILQPIIVWNNVVQAGNRRLRAAMELGLEKVPVVNCVDEFDLSRIVASQLSRQKTPSMIIRELSVLDDAYGVRQGTRSDLRQEVVKEFQKLRLKIAGSQNAISNLRKVKKCADVAFENDPQGWDQFLRKMDSGEISVASAIRKLSAKVLEQARERHRHLITAPDAGFSLYNKDSFGFDEVADDSVQCIVTSPPYFRFRDYGMGDNQLGKEATPQVFAKRLADFFNQAKRVLKPGGSMFVVLGDKVEQGSYTMSPQMFAIQMRQNGWIINDEIVWTKTHTRPSPPIRTNRSHEYVFHFVLNSEFKYFPNGLIGAQRYPGRLKNSNVITGQSNTAQRARICEEHGVAFNHTSTYPEFIPLMAIQLSTEPGDLVLDPFTGTGTSGIVAMEMGREFVGYELNPEFFTVANTLLTHFRHTSTASTPPVQNDVAPTSEAGQADELNELVLDEE
jgi:ParB/RepB/Spo0J family partition protein